MNNPYLHGLIRRIEKVSQEAEDTFGNLSNEQLNWKMNHEKWSIGQCLDHLIVSNSTYFPQFEQMTRGVKPKTLWESLPGWPQLCGYMLLRTITPDPRQKLSAPAAFIPQRSEVPSSIIAEFVTHNQLLIKYLQEIDAIDHRRTIMTSPASSFITYSLHDACQILTNHEERHLRQAKRVMELEEFPLFKE